MPARLAPLRRRAVLVVIVATQVLLAVVTGVVVTQAYRRLDDNIGAGAPIDHLAPEPEPAAEAEAEGGGPLNILLLGIDTRDCEGCAIDGEGGLGGSDATILLHVTADRTSAYGVSIPRDALVDRPACTTPSGEVVPAATEVIWNEAYAVAGAGCTARQVEQLTGLRVDHYLTLDFAGFKDMVDAVHGVTVCIPEDIDDREHGIFLEAGTRELGGKEALDYVRQRVSTPNADLGRMVRQQYLLASLTNKVISAGTLARPNRLYAFARALTSSIETDADLASTSRLVGLLQELHGIAPGDVRFVTAPNAEFPRDSEHWGRVRILPAADRLWRRMAADRPLRGKLGESAISGSDAPAPSGPPSPSDLASASPDPRTPASPAPSPSADQNGLCA